MSEKGRSSDVELTLLRRSATGGYKFRRRAVRDRDETRGKSERVGGVLERQKKASEDVAVYFGRGKRARLP